jgi:hypothetical protein
LITFTGLSSRFRPGNYAAACATVVLGVSVALAMAPAAGAATTASRSPGPAAPAHLRLPATACLPLFHARPGQQVPARPPASPDCPGGPGSVPGPAQARGRSSSSAAAAWSVAPTPNLDDSTGVISAVSCPSASACTAVGYYDNGAGTPVALAEGWNGTAWAIQSAPDPDGAQGSYLDGVSCSSASACTAVGYYVNSAGATVTLAEGWNGTAWAIQSTSNPSGAEITVLDGVSCPSATACTAAG